MWAYANGWIDAEGNAINTSMRDRQEAHDMADVASKGLAYGAAACAASVICLPAAPGIAAAGLAIDVLKNFVFSLKPVTVESRVQLSQCSRRILSHRFKEEFA